MTLNRELKKEPTSPRLPSPPRDGEDGPGGGRDWSLLTTARNQTVGYMVHGVLTAQGIECLMERFNGWPGAWLKPFGDPLAPVRLYVRKRDLESATLILHEVDHQPAERESSTDRSVMGMWLGSILTILAAAALLLLEMSSAPACLLGIYCLP